MEASSWKRRLNAIMGLYGVDLKALRSASRKHNLVLARREAWAMLRARGWSYPRIGAFFERHHTTVMSGLAQRELETQEAREQREGWL